jgi:predicted N-formylglutamate amidohydrolase
MQKTDHLLITCEHGGNRIPPRFRQYFRGHEELLRTHRGYDAGALTVAREMSKTMGAPLFLSTTSRLLVDLNRSIRHPRLYSEATREAPAAIRRQIFERYYVPYRTLVEAEIAESIASGARVVHISSHSFTPELDGVTRNADVGLLYDPARPEEAELCERWQASLRAQAPALKVRRNYPYTGTSDGFTAWLRRRFPAGAYIGIELEMNQKHVLRGGRHWRTTRNLIIGTLRQALASLPESKGAQGGQEFA